MSGERHPRRRTQPVAAAVLVLLAAGCGSSGRGAQTVVRTVTQTTTVPAPPTTTPATTPTTPSAPATTPPAPATTPTTPRPRPKPAAAPSEAPTRFYRYGFFRTPSGNIGCALAGGEARCDIRERSWSPPSPPPSCNLDYGQGLVVGSSGPARFVCAGDTTLLTEGPVLGYGGASDIGRLTCVSRSSGMTCTNTRTGHGFAISRQAFELF